MAEEQVYEEPTNGEAYSEQEPQQEAYEEQQNHYEEQPQEIEGEQQQQEEQQPEYQEHHQEHRSDHRRDDDDRKIFVGGLSWETTVKDLREYFTKFGEVADCTLKTDPITGRSRGFGFVTFNGVEAVDAVCTVEDHTLHGRTIDPKRAKARGRPEPVKKVFVGGLDDSISEDDLRKHFSEFGKVVDMDLPYDKMKNQRRAFCFITFEHESIVETVVAEMRQSINGREVDVKKATPRQDAQGPWGSQGGWGGGWGDRGGRGGRGGFDRGRGGRGRGRGRGGPPPYQDGYGRDGPPQQGWGNQGWGGAGYDYSGYYSNPGYDYSGYYNQSGYPGYGNGYDYNSYYNQGWGNYQQGYGGQGYDQSAYDYSGWYAQQAQQASTGEQSPTGYKAKAPAVAAPRGAAQYHPYQRQ